MLYPKAGGIKMKTGYNKRFIGDGFECPMPRLTAAIEAAALKKDTLRDYIYLDYKHYSVVMNRTTRQPIFTALNIDQELFKKTKSKGNWRSDSRAGRENQLNNDYYKKNNWDKGHMVMRWNTAWGLDAYEAQMADNESYYYTNAAFQHMNLNRDEWLSLEKNVVRSFSEDENNKLCVFTGPIHSELDRHYERGWHDSVRIPSAFFKIICYKPKIDANHQDMGVKAFIMHQDEEMLFDQKGAAKIKFANYQETVHHIEELTGLDFGKHLYDANPLKYFESDEKRETFNIELFPESRLITCSEDIIGDKKRPYIIEQRKKRKIAIVAAMINPSGPEKQGEYITLLNRSEEIIDLKGWKIADEKNKSVNLTGKLSPGGSKTIKGKLMEPLRLRNSGGTLKLFDAHPCLVDHVMWSKKDVSKSQGVALIFN